MSEFSTLQENESLIRAFYNEGHNLFFNVLSHPVRQTKSNDMDDRALTFFLSNFAFWNCNVVSVGRRHVVSIWPPER
jgi:hypothetical protein